MTSSESNDAACARRTLSTASQESQRREDRDPLRDELEHQEPTQATNATGATPVVTSRSSHLQWRFKIFIGLVLASGLSYLAVLQRTSEFITGSAPTRSLHETSESTLIHQRPPSSKHFRALVHLFQDESAAESDEQPTIQEAPVYIQSNNFTWTSVRTRNSSSRAKGIIIGIHDGIVALGLSLIKELRCHGNHELVQVYHCFSSELSTSSKQLLIASDDNLEIIDVCSDLTQRGLLDMHVAVRFHSWWIKPLAVYHTTLEQVIVLDADAFLLQNPDVVRKSSGYKTTGTMFFYDRVISKMSHFNTQMVVHGGRSKQLLRHLLDSFDYHAFNLSGASPSDHLLNSLAYERKSCHEQDSSMVAIDKTRPNAERAMQVLFHLITKTRFELEFSWGDKESFWLAYELAHVDYTFSPWGVSVLSSTAGNDMANHPDTLCGNMVHFVPEDSRRPELLYVNGRALLDPFPIGSGSAQETQHHKPHLLFNMNPTHVTPRQIRRAMDRRQYGEASFPHECLVGLGATLLPSEFRQLLLRRRIFYLGLELGLTSQLSRCDLDV